MQAAQRCGSRQQWRLEALGLRPALMSSSAICVRGKCICGRSAFGDTQTFWFWHVRS